MRATFRDIYNFLFHCLDTASTITSQYVEILLLLLHGKHGKCFAGKDDGKRLRRICDAASRGHIPKQGIKIAWQCCQAKRGLSTDFPHVRRATSNPLDWLVTRAARAEIT
ncbi:hypothetical protein [Methylocystis sp. JR02]|uniref:hypothetical protein n=1 Tax=Methylocystis sp. JR02 TaxID=3046284 RepID=UPI0024B97DA1|nr:hypothetical protein [Methylocystis sp. JR02]MDJ0450603.1 hypothetical protein [Methylocystis sp. JR02]